MSTIDIMYDMETWMEIAEDTPQILSNDYSDGESEGHGLVEYFSDISDVHVRLNFPHKPYNNNAQFDHLITYILLTWQWLK